MRFGWVLLSKEAGFSATLKICCLSWSLQFRYHKHFHWVLRPARLFTPVCLSVLKIITLVPMSKFSKLLLPCTLRPKYRGPALVVFVTRRRLTAEARIRSHSGTCAVFDIGLRFLWTLWSPLSLSFYKYSFLMVFCLSLMLYTASKWRWNRGSLFPCVYNCIDNFFLKKWRLLKGGGAVGRSLQIRLSLLWATYFHVV